MSAYSGPPITDEQKKQLVLALNQAHFDNFMKQHRFEVKPTFSFWLQQTNIVDKYDGKLQKRWYDRYPRWQEAVNHASHKDLRDDRTLNFFNGKMSDEQYEEQIKKMMGKDYIFPGVIIADNLANDGFIADKLKEDWDYFSEGEKMRFIDIIKIKNREFFSDRQRLYKGLLENGVGSVYAYLNNINSYFSIVSAPIEPGVETEATENYYYNFTIPRAYAVLYWYDRAQLSTGDKAKWFARVRIPNVALDTSLWARNVEDKIKTLVGDNKYFIAGFFFILAAIPAIISHI